MAEQMDAQAAALNKTVEAANPAVLAMLSRRGRRIFFPKMGILAQGAEARGKAINATIGEVTKTKSANHWIELFEEAGIPCGPIYTIDQVFADPQVQHLGMARKMQHPELGTEEVVASAINISGYSKDIRLPTPDAGTSTDEVLRSVGYTDAQLADLRKKGVI